MARTDPKSLKKTAHEAREWVRTARKVYHYRRDLLSAEKVLELQERANALRDHLKSPRRTVHTIREHIDALEPVLRSCGATYFPRNGWSENFETLLVAAILAIGIRSFFLQPFKIPTNSMYPTYHGMTHEIYEPGEAAPNPLVGLLRFATLGAGHHRQEAPASGDVWVPISRDSGRIALEGVPGRKFLVIPDTKMRSYLRVGEERVPYTVPVDFNFDKVVWERFFKEPGESYKDWEQEGGWSGERQGRRTEVDRRNPGIVWLNTGVGLERGETVLAFDIITGDALFVDRVSYNFVRPAVGDAFVFRTGEIALINSDEYYIKRIAGEGGDTLRVDEPVLYRNGEPITGSGAFQRNLETVGEYEGYTAQGDRRTGFSIGRGLTVPENHYFALGDNSDESSDSRYFGFVPEDAVVGRAFFIYHPFTRRWGPTE